MHNHLKIPFYLIVDRIYKKGDILHILQGYLQTYIVIKGNKPTWWKRLLRIPTNRIKVKIWVEPTK
jgi:hypothetical protein